MTTENYDVTTYTQSLYDANMAPNGGRMWQILTTKLDPKTNPFQINKLGHAKILDMKPTQAADVYVNLATGMIDSKLLVGKYAVEALCALFQTAVTSAKAVEAMLADDEAVEHGHPRVLHPQDSKRGFYWVSAFVSHAFGKLMKDKRGYAYAAVLTDAQQLLDEKMPAALVKYR